MKLANDRVVDIAFTLRGWLEEGMKDLAGVKRSELFSNIAHKPEWVKAANKAKAEGVGNLNDWFLDYLSEDITYIAQILHDRILDYVEGDYKTAVKIAYELNRTADEALKSACMFLIKKWQKEVDILVICMHCGKVLKRVGEATGVSHGDCLGYYGPCVEGEDYHKHNADLLGRTFEDYCKQFGPK